MARRRIGQEAFGFVQGEWGRNARLDALERRLTGFRLRGFLMGSTRRRRGAGLAAGLWHDLSDVALAEALDDRASFRRFCSFSLSEAVPERTAFVRFRKALVARRLDEVLLGAVVGQLEPQGLAVRTGTPAHRSQSTGNIGSALAVQA
jgi:IS5 family transposase